MNDRLDRLLNERRFVARRGDQNVGREGAASTPVFLTSLLP